MWAWILGGCARKWFGLIVRERMCWVDGRVSGWERELGLPGTRCIKLRLLLLQHVAIPAVCTPCPMPTCAQYSNNTDFNMTVLRFDTANSSAGMIAWFAVHGTSVRCAPCAPHPSLAEEVFLAHDGCECLGWTCVPRACTLHHPLGPYAVPRARAR